MLSRLWAVPSQGRRGRERTLSILIAFIAMGPAVTSRNAGSNSQVLPVSFKPAAR